jgi:hypothetical protein
MQAAGLVSRVGLVFAVGTVAAALTASTAGEWPLSLQPIASPAAPDSGQPQLSVEGDRAVVSWIERAGDRATLKFAERTAGGWSGPRTVSSGTNYFVNWADVPSVVRLADGTLAAHWLQKSGPGTYAYDLRLAFSKDEGRTWTASTTPHHDGRLAEHGFASLFPSPGGGLGLVWLDGRAMEMEGREAMARGSMTLRAATFDGDGKQTSEMLVDDRVCECCPTAAALTDEGPIVAFRNRSEDEIRDIYISRFVGGRWTTPAAVHDDGWKIAACPVNGPALSARGPNVAIAWFTGAGEQGQVFAAFSSDAGRTFGDPIRVHDEGAVGRVDVELLPSGAAIVAWIEFAGQRSQFRMRRIEPGGGFSASARVADISASRASGYPRMARAGDELLFAWTDVAGGGSQVKTAVARLR